MTRKEYPRSRAAGEDSGTVAKLTIKIADVLAQPGPSGYKFYRWLSAQFDNTTIFDMGTLAGKSARAFASNLTNLVITYDIDMKRQQGREFPSNVTVKNEDVNDVHPSTFVGASIIYLDISHNGVDEKKFLERIEPYFKGILVMDDIDCEKRWPELRALFMGIEKEKHLLPKSIAASRGTGVVPYGEWTVEIDDELNRLA